MKSPYRTGGTMRKMAGTVGTNRYGSTCAHQRIINALSGIHCTGHKQKKFCIFNIDRVAKTYAV
ncbi:hypothetical protein LL912_12090 [Niabella sp. CC-SYL272]|uniref:hypothetical protein n=1 Tax=Niabella agricola TaxID=2891571 RepID=UPI001F2BEA51|nr:hypothetical protein [Niabella agricola]MCF3109513.1 hypothetical protein [Niabella agricola]